MRIARVWFEDVSDLCQSLERLASDCSIGLSRGLRHQASASATTPQQLDPVIHRDANAMIE
jgi:hypothetical protein